MNNVNFLQNVVMSSSNNNLTYLYTSYYSRFINVFLYLPNVLLSVPPLSLKLTISVIFWLPPPPPPPPMAPPAPASEAPEGCFRSLGGLFPPPANVPVLEVIDEEVGRADKCQEKVAEAVFIFV